MPGLHLTTQLVAQDLFFLQVPRPVRVVHDAPVTSTAQVALQDCPAGPVVVEVSTTVSPRVTASTVVLIDPTAAAFVRAAPGPEQPFISAIEPVPDAPVPALHR